MMVTGSGPQSKVMIPPAATARTTAAEVQLAGVPVPTVRVGFEVSTAPATAGTATRPAGFPLRTPADPAGRGELAPVGAPSGPVRAGGVACPLCEGSPCGGSVSGCSPPATGSSASAPPTPGCWALRGSALGTDGPLQPDKTVIAATRAMTDLRRTP
ncbi:hypothetical protein Vqi01_51430 [Micromonospora qiuiae]|uniref:Uncharacterized protein n=1 Tax=Micromonospora qiuiae TaxID=502268 RepID=A0ABQ4JKB8_9ACTN|nr:hypothetical protein Vqi01_51430 [Micromonospora qiuiae]